MKCGKGGKKLRELEVGVRPEIWEAFLAEVMLTKALKDELDLAESGEVAVGYSHCPGKVAVTWTPDL